MMVSSLADISTDILCNNLKALSTYIPRRYDNMKIIEREGYTLIDTNKDLPLFNKVFVNSKTDNQLAREAANYFLNQKKEALWCQALKKSNYDIKHSLEELSITPLGNQVGMAIKLDALCKSVPLKDFEICRLSNKKQLEDLIKVMTEVTGCSKLEFESYFQQAADLLFSKASEMTYFLGYFKGQIAAVSMSYLDEGVVGLYGVATSGPYRKKSFGRAMSINALQFAAQRSDVKVGVLICEENLEKWYESMGFERLCDYFIGFISKR